MTYLMNTYARQPVAFTHGQGVWMWDTQGKRYLDGMAGVAVNTLGHAHPRLVSALADQLGKMIHCSNLYQITLQEQLGQKLCELSGLDAAFFCNSGLEANEAAIKIARKYGHDQGVAEPKIIVYEKSFHGRSLATLSATGNVKVQKGFEPLVPGFVRIPLNDANALHQALQDNPDVVAIFLETIQGEGGINPSQMDYLRELRTLCDAKGLLLMLDEVQCGIGRTGKWFAHQWSGIQPDVMPLAKGLGSGVPIGAVVAKGAAAKVFGPGNHGTTFGGNPLAMRAGLETLNTIGEEGLMQNASVQGERLMAGLREQLSSGLGLVEVRGKGLMIGAEFDRNCSELVGAALANQVLINVTADKVLRLLPALIINEVEIDQIIEIVSKTVKTQFQNQL